MALAAKGEVGAVLAKRAKQRPHGWRRTEQGRCVRTHYCSCVPCRHQCLCRYTVKPPLARGAVVPMCTGGSVWPLAANSARGNCAVPAQLILLYSPWRARQHAVS